MSTTLVKPAEVERKWYLLDAAGKSQMCIRDRH